jgi:hypothetical protein
MALPPARLPERRILCEHCSGMIPPQLNAELDFHPSYSSLLASSASCGICKLFIDAFESAGYNKHLMLGSAGESPLFGGLTIVAKAPAIFDTDEKPTALIDGILASQSKQSKPAPTPQFVQLQCSGISRNGRKGIPYAASLIWCAAGESANHRILLCLSR